MEGGAPLMHEAAEGWSLGPGVDDIYRPRRRRAGGKRKRRRRKCELTDEQSIIMGAANTHFIHHRYAEAHDLVQELIRKNPTATAPYQLLGEVRALLPMRGISSSCGNARASLDFLYNLLGVSSRRPPPLASIAWSC